MIRIREVPPLMWRYVHTCPNCGGHNVTIMAIDGRPPVLACIKVCSFCGIGYKDREKWPEGDEAVRLANLRPSQREIEEAILEARGARP